MVYHDKINPSRAMLVGQFTAHVAHSSDKKLTLRVNDQLMPATRAASCLLEARSKDQVLCWGDGENIYVTDVLELDAGERRLRLHEAITELTGTHLAIKMDEEFSIHTKIFRTVSKHWQQWSGHIDITAKRMIQMITHCTAHFHERHQKVDQLDARKVGTSMLQADDAIIQQADAQIIVGKEDIRMDAKRISMG